MPLRGGVGRLMANAILNFHFDYWHTSLTKINPVRCLMKSYSFQVYFWFHLYDFITSWTAIIYNCLSNNLFIIEYQMTKIFTLKKPQRFHPLLNICAMDLFQRLENLSSDFEGFLKIKNRTRYVYENCICICSVSWGFSQISRIGLDN